jgi:hypothetical protein
MGTSLPWFWKKSFFVLNQCSLQEIFGLVG